MIQVFKNNRWLLILLVVFIASRLFGLSQLYHQDEYRWATIVNIDKFGGFESPHPPLIEFFLSLTGKIWGFDRLRLVPIFFGLLNFILIYAISIMLGGGRRRALVAVSLYTFNVYSLISNLQIDIDGAVLPFFVLLTYYFYLKLVGGGNNKFIFLLLASVVLGFLTKLSFVLFVGAIAADYIILSYQKGKFGTDIRRIFYFLAGVAAIIAGLYVFYLSEHPRIIQYARHFQAFNYGSRAYFELFLRLFKFFIWLSPLLFLPWLASFRNSFLNKHRIWYIYAFFNLIFYLIIFDFTRLPIERYFMFIIVPSVFIGADIIHSLLPRFSWKYLLVTVAGLAGLTAFVLLQGQAVIPLNPKDAYVEKLLSFNLDFLIPLTGGSGPIGFYQSAQFILAVWVVCVVALIFRRKAWAAYLFIVFGFGYNLLLSNENLFGTMYGSVNNITEESVEYVIKNKDIKSVITYYDTGAYYLKLAGKYDARFYTAPTRDYTARIDSYRGHYMIVNFPAVGENNQYWKMISRCRLDKKFSDKYVESFIFDCGSLPSND